jgi:hypothetical protein
MFKKTVLALTTVATLAGAAVTFSAPAEAHMYPFHPGHHFYWGHPHVFVNTFAVPGPDCYWVSRHVRIWTPGGPVWERRNVQVCD